MRCWILGSGDTDVEGLVPEDAPMRGPGEDVMHA